MRRPRLYPELMYLVWRTLIHKGAVLDRTEQESRAWCAPRAIDPSAAIAKITGSPMPCAVREKFADVFATATQKAADCPVRMGGPANLDLLYWIAESCQAEKVVETGVAYGWSSLALLLSMQNRSNAMLLSTDMHLPTWNIEEYVGCVVPPDLASRWQMLNYADRQAIPAALKRLGSIDMCHYDSDKSYHGRLWAYPRLWNALRPGGIFISDDIQDNVGFRDFANALTVEPIIVGWNGKYLGILVKPNDA